MPLEFAHAAKYESYVDVADRRSDTYCPYLGSVNIFERNYTSFDLTAWRAVIEFTAFSKIVLIVGSKCSNGVSVPFFLIWYFQWMMKDSGEPLYDPSPSLAAVIYI